LKAFLFSTSLPQIIGPDLKPYGPFEKGEIILEVKIPREIAGVLKARKVVSELSLEEALLLISMREELKENYVLTDAKLLKKDLITGKKDYILFNKLSEAKEYLDKLISNYRKKGLLLHELGPNAYQIGKVQYVLITSLRPKKKSAMTANINISHVNAT